MSEVGRCRYSIQAEPSMRNIFPPLLDKFLHSEREFHFSFQIQDFPGLPPGQMTRRHKSMGELWRRAIVPGAICAGLSVSWQSPSHFAGHNPGGCSQAHIRNKRAPARIWVCDAYAGWKPVTIESRRNEYCVPENIATRRSGLSKKCGELLPPGVSIIGFKRINYEEDRGSAGVASFDTQLAHHG